MTRKKAVVIGAGFAGLSAAAYLAKDGMDVTILEKNEQTGGRARKFKQDGFTFDMGPSWYWMAEIFEEFYQDFGKTTADFYELKRIDPSYQIYFSQDKIEVPAGQEALFQLFEKYEKGSSKRLKKFLEEAEYKYNISINEFVRKPNLSIMEFADTRLFAAVFRLHMFQSISSYIRKHFSHPYLIQLLEFPVLFLGATPAKTPALYSMMNHVDLNLGTWYPMGGMYNIVDAMTSIAKAQGVKIKVSEPVEKVEMQGNRITKVISNKNSYEVDVCIGAADYQHIESKIIPEAFQSYSKAYWESRVLAPSCLIYFLGIGTKIPSLQHHNLFFDKDFEQHAEEIYEDPKWPSDPLFYVCAASVTDPSIAPEAMENLFVLIPVATKIEEEENTRDYYFDKVMTRLEKFTKTPIREHIIFKKSYAHREFISDYNSFKGNAYGLANTLKQTAILKPSVKSKKIKNMYYCGQLSVPGPGVPPAILSGNIVARLLKKEQNG